jgi:hypothetical protein
VGTRLFVQIVRDMLIQGTCQRLCSDFKGRKTESNQGSQQAQSHLTAIRTAATALYEQRSALQPSIQPSITQLALRDAVVVILSLLLFVDKWSATGQSNEVPNTHGLFRLELHADRHARVKRLQSKNPGQCLNSRVYKMQPWTCTQVRNGGGVCSKLKVHRLASHVWQLTSGQQQHSITLGKTPQIVVQPASVSKVRSKTSTTRKQSIASPLTATELAESVVEV